MKKSNIVQKNTDFSKIINQGTCVKDKNLVIYALNNDLLKAKQNAEYLSMLNNSIKEIENGGITIKTIDELENYE